MWFHRPRPRQCVVASTVEHAGDEYTMCEVYSTHRPELWHSFRSTNAEDDVYSSAHGKGGFGQENEMVAMPLEWHSVQCLLILNFLYLRKVALLDIVCPHEQLVRRGQVLEECGTRPQCRLPWKRAHSPEIEQFGQQNAVVWEARNIRPWACKRSQLLMQGQSHSPLLAMVIGKSAPKGSSGTNAWC